MPTNRPNRVGLGALRVACALLVAAGLVAGIACGSGGGDGVTATREQAPPDSIAFGAQEGATGAQEGETGAQEGETYGLYLVQPDGAFLRSIAGETAPVSSPVWSPTGDRIAYHVGADAARATATLRVYDFATLTATTASDSALISGPLISGLGPAISWSPDGGRLAFAEEGGRIRIYDAGRGVLEEAAAGRGDSVAWRPGGDEFAITRDGNVYLAAGGGDERPLDERPLLERELSDAAPVWSPGGESLAFVSFLPGAPANMTLSVLSVADGSITEIGPGSGAAWSPDGSSLAYSAPVAEGTPDVDIVVAVVAGGEPRVLSGPTTLDVAPSWSPDGGRIVYLAQADRQTAFVCLVALEGDDRDCLDLPGADAGQASGLLPGAPAWSPH